MSHTPKIAALIALDEGLLSPPGKRRLERHLAGCAICRSARASVRALEVLTTEARDQEWPEPQWGQMELALAREARAVATHIRHVRQSSRYPVMGMLAAAAVIVVIVSQVAEGPSFDHRTGGPRAPAAVQDDGSVIEGSVVAVSGVVHVDRVRVEPGTVLREGARLSVAPTGARVHARLTTDTGLVALPGTTVDFDRLREHAVVLGLATGEVASQVRHLGDGERYEVRAGDYLVRVRGTRFSVRRLGDEVAVTVDEGFVEVSDRSAVLALVHAPGTWVSSPSMIATPLGGVAAPRALSADSARWPLVTLPQASNIGAWMVDGAPFEAGGALRMRAPVGPLPIIATDLHGIPMSFVYDVGSNGGAVDISRLTFGAPGHLEPHRGVLSQAEMRAVVRAGAIPLQYCWESALRLQPNLSEHAASVRVTIDASGHVEHSSVDVGGASNARLDACIASHVMGWEFPPPHGPMTFQFPLTAR